MIAWYSLFNFVHFKKLSLLECRICYMFWKLTYKKVKRNIKSKNFGNFKHSPECIWAFASPSFNFLFMIDLKIFLVVFKTLLYQRLLQWFNQWQLGIYQAIAKLDIFAIALISHCWYYARHLKWKLTSYNLTDHDFSDAILLIFLLNLKFFGMSTRFVNLFMNFYFRLSLKCIR